MTYQHSNETIQRVAQRQYELNREEQERHMNAQVETQKMLSRHAKNPTYAMTDAAKLLGIGPIELFKLLREKKVLFKDRHGNNLPYPRYVKDGYFKTDIKPREQIGVGMVIYATTRVTCIGMEWLADKLQEWSVENV